MWPHTAVAALAVLVIRGVGNDCRSFPGALLVYLDGVVTDREGLRTHPPDEHFRRASSTEYSKAISSTKIPDLLPTMNPNVARHYSMPGPWSFGTRHNRMNISGVPVMPIGFICGTILFTGFPMQAQARTPVGALWSAPSGRRPLVA
jgi:hypothetical protein